MVPNISWHDCSLFEEQPRKNIKTFTPSWTYFSTNVPVIMVSTFHDKWGDFKSLCDLQPNTENREPLKDGIMTNTDVMQLWYLKLELGCFCKNKKKGNLLDSASLSSKQDLKVMRNAKATAEGKRQKTRLFNIHRNNLGAPVLLLELSPLKCVFYANYHKSSQ